MAGPCTAALGLHSIHSYGYESHSSPASIGTCVAPCLRILVRYAGWPTLSYTATNKVISQANGIELNLSPGFKSDKLWEKNEMNLN